ALPRVLAVSALALRRPPDVDGLARADAVPAAPGGSRPLIPATDVAERVKKFENRVGDVLQRPDLPYRRNPFSRFLHTLAVGAWRIDRATPWVTMARTAAGTAGQRNTLTIRPALDGAVGRRDRGGVDGAGGPAGGVLIRGAAR